MHKNTVHILLVEDNEGDILLIKEAFEEAKIVLKMSIVNDGQSAIDFLNQLPPYQKATPPDLILLDINLPRLNGHEVLCQIKSNEVFKSIPVIMLTTSSSPKDINTAYANHVNSYITKPVDINNFLNVVTGIENFWINIVNLPTNR
ncbi:response regulator [Marivirga sp. S37H4]|uniref:Response regulator n=1 Tax=Marivirga aurantiaca TaxID=2802615 RepID=A0A934WW91_9BACT|nr:response regulator [Marivirga aurantiaca]MBK6264139.1 response regulator [Marivirga aurantiaca]